MEKTQTYSNQERPMSMHPNKFSLWLFMITVVMLFAAFTSAYLVRSEGGDWMQFQLPTIFLYNTIILVVSSVTLHYGFISLKNDKLQVAKYAVVASIALGMLFMILQMTAAWSSLIDIKVYLGGAESNPAGSFVYVFFLVHVAHLIAGVGFLLMLYSKMAKSKVDSKNMLTMEMAVTFWHFLGLLWVYLYVFLLINN